MICYFVIQIATSEAFFKDVGEDIVNYIYLVSGQLSFLLVQLCMFGENVNILYLETHQHIHHFDDLEDCN